MKSRSIVSLAVVGLTLSLTGCFWNNEPEPEATPAPVELEVAETKKNVQEELKKLVNVDDMKTNKALIIGDELLLVTYAADECVQPPNSVMLKDGNSLLVELPEPKPALACDGKPEAQGWDVEIPEEKASDIKSAQLIFPNGMSGGISVYTIEEETPKPEEAAKS